LSARGAAPRGGQSARELIGSSESVGLLPLSIGAGIALSTSQSISLPASLLPAANWLRRETTLVVFLIVLSIGLALSEGVSVSVLIPALESTAVTGVLSTIPVLGALAARLAQIPESYRLLAITGLLAVALIVRGGMQLGSQFLSALIPLRLHCAIMTRCYD